MTQQEIFDAVWDHFVVKKNPRSLDAAGDCAYRGENGARCVVGLFIPDDKYRETLEGENVWSARVQAVIPDTLLPHLGFLRTLQGVHDGSADAFVNEEVLRNVAQCRDLTVPE